MKQMCGKKKVYDYWWDFLYEKYKIVGVKIQSNNDLYPIIEKLYFKDYFDENDLYIEAEQIIVDLKEGRRITK
jgi:hypothetical protein